MKSSEILREAARLVECGEEEYGCMAIDTAICDLCSVGFFSTAFSNREMVAKQWLGMFEPETTSSCGGYWHYKIKGPRIIGLCLAAAIAESEGD